MSNVLRHQQNTLLHALINTLPVLAQNVIQYGKESLILDAACHHDYQDQRRVCQLDQEEAARRLRLPVRVREALKVHLVHDELNQQTRALLRSSKSGGTMQYLRSCPTFSSAARGQAPDR